MEYFKVEPFKRGQIIMIYKDPYTCLESEGMARVVRFLEQVDTYIERYLVHFIGDAPRFNVERLVRRD